MYNLHLKKKIPQMLQYDVCRKLFLDDSLRNRHYYYILEGQKEFIHMH